MDYIREAEKYLYHYRDLEKSLEWQEKEINKLMWQGAPRDISAVYLDGMPKGSIHDETINTLFKLNMYVGMKKETEEEISKIDEILKDIGSEQGCENYEKVLRMWYIEGKSKEEIAQALNYNSRTSIYEIRNQAIRKFAIRLFGIDALKAI